MLYLHPYCVQCGWDNRSGRTDLFSCYSTSSADSRTAGLSAAGPCTAPLAIQACVISLHVQHPSASPFLSQQTSVFRSCGEKWEVCFPQISVSATTLQASVFSPFSHALKMTHHEEVLIMTRHSLTLQKIEEAWISSCAGANYLYPTSTNTALPAS